MSEDKSIICKLGRCDIPEVQKQYDFNVNLLKSNIILFGSPQSGKSNLIKLIINILHKIRNENNEQIFILDFGGALVRYKEMPLVSAYFDNSNEEYVKRVFKILDNELKKNNKKLEETGFAQYQKNDIKHTTFLIDNFNAFLDEPRYVGYQEKLSRICRDGLSKGITVIVTASETKGTSNFLNSFSQKIAINLTNSKYEEIFGMKVSNIGNIAGRGFANITFKSDDMKENFNLNCPYEIHCSLAEKIDSNDFEYHLHKKFKYDVENKTFSNQAKKYQTFSDELTKNEYLRLTEKSLDEYYLDFKNPEKYKDSKDYMYKFIAGLDYVDFKPVTLNFKESRCLAVYSQRDFGREHLIERIVTRLIDISPERKLVLFDDGRHLLEPLKKKYEYKNENLIYISQFKEVDIPDNSVNEVSTAQKVKSTNNNNNFQRSHISLDFLGINNNKNSEITPDLTKKKRKLSPIRQFYKYIHENCTDIGNFASYVYIGEKIVNPVRDSRIPYICKENGKDSTVFVIQSKLAYSSVEENKNFIQYILPMLADIAEDRDYIFIFSDVKKMSDASMNETFNSIVRSVVILDNIAEFVSERGNKTILSEMDINNLKSDYAKCEYGDGYYYDVEADNLKKLKFIKEDEIK